MTRQSAGILPYRFENDVLKVFLVHPGGPFWEKKDEGAWSIAKGEFEESEDPLEAAKREFEEETGFGVNGEMVELTPIKQKSGKVVYSWAVESEIDAAKIKSDTFEMEWPPKSGQKQSFPEIDRSEWLPTNKARTKILPAQLPLIEELEKKLDYTPPPPEPKPTQENLF